MSARIPRLVMADLDGTLVDRNTAFRAALDDFCVGYGLDAAAADWIVTVDRDGYTPRSEVAAAMLSRFEELKNNSDDVDSLLALGGADRVTLDPGVARALTALRAAGTVVIVVTNGPTLQQELKLAYSGLDALVDGWVISEAVGVKKPDAAIFYTAADRARSSLDGAWMIGDSPAADIRGGHAVGCMTAWVSHGRVWPYRDFHPSICADTVVTALERLIVP